MEGFSLLCLPPTGAGEGAEQRPLVPGLCPALALGKVIQLEKQEGEADRRGSGLWLLLAPQMGCGGEIQA